MDEPTEKRKVGHPGGASRRPANKRQPEPTPTLSEADKEALSVINGDELFLTNDELTCVHISMKTSREEAAKRLNWALAKVRKTLEQPHVKLYAIQYREKFISVMVNKEITQLVRQGITPTSVQQRLMDLAMLPPDATKGSIDGQVKALTELSNHLGLKKDDPLGDKSEEELKAIVAAGAKQVNKTVQ
jgi:hypothetical protein